MAYRDCDHILVDLRRDIFDLTINVNLKIDYSCLKNVHTIFAVRNLGCPVNDCLGPHLILGQPEARFLLPFLKCFLSRSFYNDVRS